MCFLSSQISSLVTNGLKFYSRDKSFHIIFKVNSAFFGTHSNKLRNWGNKDIFYIENIRNNMVFFLKACVVHYWIS